MKTTISNLIDGMTIEKAREIVEGAPEVATHINQTPNYFKNISHPYCEMWNPYDQVWFETEIFSCDEFCEIYDLRTAIASHREFEVDGLLNAISSLSPKNIPEIEQLPIAELKVGDECLLVWSEDREVWKVISFSADGDVDVVCVQHDAHMCVPRSELRLAKFYRDSNTDDTTDIRNHVGSSCEVKNG